MNIFFKFFFQRSTVQTCTWGLQQDSSCQNRHWCNVSSLILLICLDFHSHHLLIIRPSPLLYIRYKWIYAKISRSEQTKESLWGPTPAHQPSELDWVTSLLANSQWRSDSNIFISGMSDWGSWVWSWRWGDNRSVWSLMPWGGRKKTPAAAPQTLLLQKNENTLSLCLFKKKHVYMILWWRLA